MVKKIASLDVVIDDTAKCPASRLESNYQEMKFTLRLCPNSGNPLERTAAVPIMAHELGHFVANLLGTPTARKSLIDHALNIDGPLWPSEAEAWAIADQIVPNASKSPAFEQSKRSYLAHDDSI